MSQQKEYLSGNEYLVVQFHDGVDFDADRKQLAIPYNPVDKTPIVEGLKDLNFNNIEVEHVLQRVQEISEQAIVRSAIATQWQQ